MTKLLLTLTLVAVSALALIITGCSDSPDDQDAVATSRDNVAPKEGKDFDPYTIKTDNSAYFWVNKKWKRESYPDPADTEKELSKDFNKDLTAAVKRMGDFFILLKAAHGNCLSADMRYQFSLESAISDLSHAAKMDKEKYFAPTVKLVKAAVPCKWDRSDAIAGTFSLYRAYPEDKEVIGLLTVLKQGLVGDLKAVKFSPDKRYNTKETRITLDFDFPLFAENHFMTLAKIEDVLHNSKEVKVWQIHYADYNMSGHEYDGKPEEPNPMAAYLIYRDLGMHEDKKAAALLAGDIIAHTFFMGKDAWGYNGMERDPFVESDRADAMDWYMNKAGLTLSEATDRLRPMSEKAVAEAKQGCDTTQDKAICGLLEKQQKILNSL